MAFQTLHIVSKCVLRSCVGSQPAPYRGLAGPPGPTNADKSLENVGHGPRKSLGKVSKKSGKSPESLRKVSVREAPDTFNFSRHVMRAIWSVRPKCSHRCVSLKETPLKPVQILKHTTFYSAEQTAYENEMV